MIEGDGVSHHHLQSPIAQAELDLGEDQYSLSHQFACMDHIAD